MEDTLRVYGFNLMIDGIADVLILVLMEDTLRVRTSIAYADDATKS